MGKTMEKLVKKVNESPKNSLEHIILNRKLSKEQSLGALELDKPNTSPKREHIGIFPDFNASISKLSQPEDELDINISKLKIVEESSSDEEYVKGE